MRKIKTVLSQMPRAARIATNLCLAAAALFAWYIFRGCPALSAETAFRRVERARNVGPGEIICKFTAPGINSDSHIAAKTDFGAEVFSFQKKRYSEGSLNYVPCGENGLTLCGESGRSFMGGLVDEMYYPLVLFDEFPAAVCAELDLHYDINDNENNDTFDYHLSAEREYAGCFLFVLHVQSQNGGRLGTEGWAVDDLTAAFNEWAYNGASDITAAIRLLDEKGVVICEQELQLTR